MMRFVDSIRCFVNDLSTQQSLDQDLGTDSEQVANEILDSQPSTEGLTTQSQAEMKPKNPHQGCEHNQQQHIFNLLIVLGLLKLRTRTKYFFRV